MKAEEFYLMNRDEKILSFEARMNEFQVVDFTEKERFDAPLPIGFFHIHAFLKGRQAPKKRMHIESLLQHYGCNDLLGFIKLTHALSLNDTFWVKSTDSSISWDDVSLYQHPFDEVIAQSAFEGGFATCADPAASPEFGTDGTFPKCWVREGDTISLYKAGSVYMELESYSEFYAAQLAKIICPEIVDYDLDIYRDKLISKCSLFTNEDVGYVPYHKINPNVVSVKDIVRDFDEVGSGDLFRRMVVLDALIFNTDRHLGNFGFLVDNKTQKLLRMAPVFDHNQALLPYAKDKNLANLSGYLPSRVPVLGDDFNTFAHAMLTPEIKKDLLKLYGFKFERHEKYNLQEERLQLLERIVNRQIINILKNRAVSRDSWNMEEEFDLSSEFELLRQHECNAAIVEADEKKDKKISLTERIKGIGNKTIFHRDSKEKGLIKE